LILLLPFVIFLNWRNLISFPKRHPALALVLLGLFLYAVSNHIWLGVYELVTFPLPAWLHDLTGAFRVAGRFFGSSGT
jgi:apolipoprotein N-acyltransferase